MRNYRSLIAGVGVIAASVVGVIVTEQPGHGVEGTRSAITYCETNPAGRHYETFIELADGTEFTVTDIRPNWSPFLGQRRLIESPVQANQPRVIDCVVTRVNGVRTAVLTTSGGAEWHVTRPWTEW